MDAIGAGAAGWTVGDRAGLTWLAGTDGTCRFCRSGRENLCESATFTGWDRDGGFAEAVVARADVPSGCRTGSTTSRPRRSCAAV